MAVHIEAIAASAALDISLEFQALLAFMPDRNMLKGFFLLHA